MMAQVTERRRRSGGARFPLELEDRGPELTSLSSLVILPVFPTVVSVMSGRYGTPVVCESIYREKECPFFLQSSGACEDETW